MIFIMAGTSDAREVAIALKEAGYPLLASVVTESGAASISEAGIPVRVGRLTIAEMTVLLCEKHISLLVDATHPFAEEASKNAHAAAEQAGIPYVRFERQASEIAQDERISFVADYAEAAGLASQHKGVVMLTTGSKTLAVFAKKLLGLPDLRMIARMLPRKDNMERCEQLGIEQKNIVAMQGPFSKELNKALYRQFGVTLVITKESGKVGSVDEKLEAARELGLEVIVIERPKQDVRYLVHTKEDVVATVTKLMEGK